MCRACRADLSALADKLTGLIRVEAEACAQQIEVRADIDRILDGKHSIAVLDRAAGSTAPSREPPR